MPDGQAGRSGWKAEDVVPWEDDVHQLRLHSFHCDGVTIDGDQRCRLRVTLLCAGP